MQTAASEFNQGHSNGSKISQRPSGGSHLELSHPGLLMTSRGLLRDACMRVTRGRVTRIVDGRDAIECQAPAVQR